MLNLKNICLYLIFVLSLFVGFIFQENASGGAKIDHDFFQTYINYFYLDFETGLKKFLENPSTIIQLPVFYILISFFYKIFDNLRLNNIFPIKEKILLPIRVTKSSSSLPASLRYLEAKMKSFIEHNSNIS